MANSQPKRPKTHIEDTVRLDSSPITPISNYNLNDISIILAHCGPPQRMSRDRDTLYSTVLTFETSDYKPNISISNLTLNTDLRPIHNSSYINPKPIQT